MRGVLFTIFIIAFSIALAVTAVGLLVNWGLIESPLAQPGEPLPLLDKLVTGVIIAGVGLLIEVGRQWFTSKPKESAEADAYRDMLALSIVQQATRREEAEATFTEIIDYFREYYFADNPEMKEGLIKRTTEAVGRALQVRFGGAAHAEAVAEVLEVQERTRTDIPGEEQ